MQRIHGGSTEERNVPTPEALARVSSGRPVYRIRLKNIYIQHDGSGLLSWDMVFNSSRTTAVVPSYLLVTTLAPIVLWIS